jgi:hypothetical protein
LRNRFVEDEGKAEDGNGDQDSANAEEKAKL